MLETANYNSHWEDIFRTRNWGEYPNEDLIRFVKRSINNRIVPQNGRLLEMGCGPGANLIFFRKEGLKLAAIDISPSAIKKAKETLMQNQLFVEDEVDLRQGNFSSLPWKDEYFDMIVDNFAIYANTADVVKISVEEAFRVLKKDGVLFSKFWGKNTTGFGEGKQLGPNTFNEIPNGPCFKMGIAHFVDEVELEQLFGRFSKITIDVITRTDRVQNHFIEEFLCQAYK